MLKLIFKEADKLKQLDQLIRLKCTGTPENLASKMGISKRHVRNYITVLEDMGAEITYSRTRQTFVYQGAYKLNVEISLVELDETNLKKVSGGNYNASLCILNFRFYTMSYIYIHSNMF